MTTETVSIGLTVVTWEAAGHYRFVFLGMLRLADGSTSANLWRERSHQPNSGRLRSAKRVSAAPSSATLGGMGDQPSYLTAIR